MILNNGWVLIEKGRDAVLRDEEGEAYVTTPSELLSLQFDLKDLSLVDNHGQMFLDRAGAQMQARGLTWHEVDATRFEEVEQLPTGCGMFSLASLTGDLTLDYDGVSGKFELRFCTPETEDAPAQEFNLAGRIPTESAHADTPEALGETEETKPGCQSPECTGGGSCSLAGRARSERSPFVTAMGPTRCASASSRSRRTVRSAWSRSARSRRSGHSGTRAGCCNDSVAEAPGFGWTIQLPSQGDTAMSRCRIIMGVCACAFLTLLACVSPLRADRTTDSGPPAQLAKSCEPSIDYEGPGHLVILNNGWVLIEKGREGGYIDKEDEWHWTVTSELLNLKFDRTDLTLVDHHGELFLDRAGAQMEVRGLSWRQVDATRFEEVEQPPEGCGMFSVVSLTGDLTLEYDGASGAVRLTICGEETEDTPAQEFTLIAHRGAKRSSAVQPEALGDDEPGCQSPKCCDKASCSFSGECQAPKIAVCYCDGCSPVCTCRKLPEEDHDIGPEPVSRP